MKGSVSIRLKVTVSIPFRPLYVGLIPARVGMIPAHVGLVPAHVGLVPADISQQSLKVGEGEETPSVEEADSKVTSREAESGLLETPLIGGGRQGESC